jgi:hypothetical protein
MALRASADAITRDATAWNGLNVPSLPMILRPAGIVLIVLSPLGVEDFGFGIRLFDQLSGLKRVYPVCANGAFPKLIVRQPNVQLALRPVISPRAPGAKLIASGARIRL